MTASERQLSATLIELADTLVSDFDTVDYLDLLLTRSTDVLSTSASATAGGVMLANGEQLELLAATDEHVRTMELFEVERREGPCIDSYRTGQQIIESDLSTSRRWPRFTPVALERGYRSVIALPMRLRARRMGALNLYRTTTGPVRAGDLSAAQAFADMATIGILNAQALREAKTLAGQLQAALNSRIVIEQAKGILAERGGLDVGTAFQALRLFARNHNRHIREVAAEVVTGILDPRTVLEPHE